MAAGLLLANAGPEAGAASAGRAPAAVATGSMTPPAGGMRDARDARAARDDDYAGMFDAVHELLGRRYPSFELKAIDWEAVGQELRPRAEAADDDEELGAVLVELVSRLRDGNATLVPGTREVPGPRPRVYGPGLTCLVDGEDRIVVFHVVPGSPAAAKDIRPGDIIRSIDGRPAGEVLAESAAKMARHQGQSSDRALRHRAVRQLFRADEPDRSRTLTVARLGGRERELELFAMMQPPPPPRSPVQLAGIPSHPPVSWGILDGDLGYIAVRRGGGPLRSLRTAMRELRSTRALIVDVRGHSGGDFDPDNAFAAFDRAPGEPPLPIAVLIDPGTTGEGEAWASWFTSTGRARFYGEATAGSASVTEDVDVAGGKWRLRLPMRLLRGSLDRPIEGRGLEPDVPVRPLAEDIAEGRDTLIERVRHDLRIVTG